MYPQFNATKGLGVEVDHEMLTTYDIIKGGESISTDNAILETQWERLDMIPSHIDLAGAEVELVDEVGRENRLKEALEDITGGYDFILLDTPPAFHS